MLNKIHKDSVHTVHPRRGAPPALTSFVINMENVTGVMQLITEKRSPGMPTILKEAIVLMTFQMAKPMTMRVGKYTTKRRRWIYMAFKLAGAQ